MSKAEELARQVIHEWEDYALGGARVHEVVSELRRLAQVEAEHAALLKAISDAAPVAFAPKSSIDWMQEAGSLASVTTKLFKTPPSARDTAPLYTLNGIKKP